MTKPITGFQCDMCLAIKTTEELAGDCERSHGTDFEVKFSFAPNKLGPDGIEVKFKKPNGESWTKTFY